MDKTAVATVMAACKWRLLKSGVSFEVRRDFANVDRLLKEIDKPYLTPRLSSEINDFTEKDAMWVILKSEGRPYGSIGARFHDIGRMNFGQYLQETNSRHYGIRDGKALAEIAPPAQDMCAGKLAYFGDMYFHPDHRGSPAQLRDVAVLCQSVLALEWDYDYVFCFTGRRAAKVARNLDYGFSRWTRNAQTWSEPVPDGRANSEWLLASSHDDMDHFFQSEAVKEDRQMSK